MNAMSSAFDIDPMGNDLDQTIRLQARDAVNAVGLPRYPFVVDHAEQLIKRGLGMADVHAGLVFSFKMLLLVEGDDA